MSDVAESGSGPAAGEVGDQTETIVVVIDLAPAADDTTITIQNADTTLHAVLSMAETDAVPETGVVPTVGEILQSDGQPAGIAGPVSENGAAAPGSASQGDAPAKLNGASRATGPDQAPAVSKPAGPERPMGSGRPTGQARTGQAPARRSEARSE